MESSLNNFVGNLSDAETWLGSRELIPHGTGTLSLNLSSTTDLILTISQSLDGSKFVWTDNFNHVFSIFGSVTRTQIPIKGSFVKVSLLNVSGGTAVNVILSTFFSPNGIDSTIEQPARISGSVDVLNGMKATEKVFNTLREVACDDDGRLIVNINGGGGSSVVEVSNFPAIQEVSGEVSVTNFTPFTGSNTDFAFYPDATNSTSAIYADGQQPTATNQAGWVYTNNGTAPNKINWYVFQDVTLPQYLVSEMESIYFVITQLPTATSLPFVSFYTMPNGIDDVVPNFAKSKLVFAPSGAVPTTQGEYLFYVKTDPVDGRGLPIRPEITERYELTFVEAQSSKTLEQASGERLSLSTLSTGSTDPVGSNYFLFQQYGIQWAKTSVYLPVDNNRLLTTETNSGAISTTLTSLNGKVTACNTGAISGNVTLTGTDVEMNSTPIYNTLVAVNGKIINCDTNNVTLSNTLGIKSYTATNTRAKRAISIVANALLSINYYNDAGSINFILLYDLGVASVTVGTTQPIAVFALNKNQGDTIDLHRLLIGPAITLAVAGDYDGSTDPHGAGAYLTVSTLTSN